MSEIRKVQKSSVCDEVYNEMMDKIVTGNWPQGSQIPSENSLCESFGVSRDTVRQAIKRMCAIGLLQSRQGKGTFVCKVDLSVYMNRLIPIVFLSEDDGTHLLQFMKTIQMAVASDAAGKATEEDIAKLQLCMDKMETECSDEEYFKYDNDFHLRLASISENPLYVKSMEITSGMLTHYLTNMVRFHGRDQSIAQHQKCLDAIIAGDCTAAAYAMKEHYTMLEERLNEELNK